MKEEIEYTNEVERTTIIATKKAQGLRLAEDAIRLNGQKLLYFTDEPPPPKPRDAIEEINALKARIEALEGQLEVRRL